MSAKNTTTKKTLREEYIEFFEEILKMFYEREWEGQQLRYALLIREHVLLKGEPGTAKSMLAKKIFRGLDGSEVYESQFTRFQDDSYVFGPQLIEEFKKGIIKHNTAGTLVTAHFGFLDEFFNASEELIVSTNEILNERTFTRPGQKEDCNLISAVITTNQEREGEKELRATFDRILFKSDVKDLSNSQNRIGMYSDYLNKKYEEQPVFEFKKFQKLLEEFDTYKPTFPSSALSIFDSIVTEYTIQSGVKVSPRKRNKLLKVILASAFLRGSDLVESHDVEQCKFALVEGGDAKNLSYFDGVFGKIKVTMEKMEKVGKMEALLKDAAKETDLARKYKIYLGLSKKAQDMIDEVKGDQALNHYTKQLEGIRDKSKELMEKVDVKDEDLFK